MRRIATLTLVLTVGACAQNTWMNPPLTGGFNPNRPHGDGVNLLRAMGDNPAVTPLLPEPGDIWPGPLPPMPTLQDVERDSGMSHIAPGATPVPGSSSPPIRSAIPPLPSQSAPPASTSAAPPARDPAGRIIQAPSGPGVTSGGTPNYQTTTTPGGGSAIVVPNGNGTSTVIHSDGRIETIPTPK